MIVRIFAKILERLSRFLPSDQFEKMLERMIQKRSSAMSSQDALRLLFRLDAATYALEGPLAVLYGGGVHPKHRQTRYHKFFTERIKKGERVLDIGCGIGAVAYDLASTGAVVDGIDLNEASIAEAKRRFTHPNLHFAVQDALKLEQGKSYDTVLLSNVLEHLQERPSFLARVRTLTGAKRFFIRVPSFERDWRVPLKQELEVEWRLDLDHKTEYTMDQFLEESKAAGLSVKYLEVHWGEIWAELQPI